jgi:hypothetical protein
MTLTSLLTAIVGGFLCGSIPFGYWAGKLKGLDIRQHGSGNIGATNVIRVCGKGIGIPVFILDMLKGWLPTWYAGVHLAAGTSSGTTLAVLAGFAAILGHTFTPWLGFKGGKGVATATGVLIGIRLARLYARRCCSASDDGRDHVTRGSMGLCAYRLRPARRRARHPATSRKHWALASRDGEQDGEEVMKYSARMRP